jgi:phosphoserine aminotransferase
VSHRSPAFDEVINDAAARARRLLGLDDRFKVLFMQGGASLQFALIPMNLMADGDSADYVDTGTWSTKAIKEARVLGRSVKVVASSEDRDFCYIPKEISFSPDAAFAHITSNNTIKGTQWASFPEIGAPLVADMSSDMFSRRFDPSRFGLIYAGAQKNIGPSGVTVVIIRKSWLEQANQGLPTMLSYTTFSAKDSLYNTPPTFAIYMVRNVLQWLKDNGGLAAMEKTNRAKGDLLYSVFEQSGGFYSSPVAEDSRSYMNVVFRLPSEELEKKFVAEAKAVGMVGLKGHRSVGGCRASIYNAMPLQGVEILAEFMREFARVNG